MYCTHILTDTSECEVAKWETHLKCLEKNSMKISLRPISFFTVNTKCTTIGENAPYWKEPIIQLNCLDFSTEIHNKEIFHHKANGESVTHRWGPARTSVGGRTRSQKLAIPKMCTNSLGSRVQPDRSISHINLTYAGSSKKNKSVYLAN